MQSARVQAKRKGTVEPVFGIIKSVMGFRSFLLCGLELVTAEWKLVCIAWNLKRLQVLINDEWDYVFCTKEGVLLPIITKSKNKALSDRFGNGIRYQTI